MKPTFFKNALAFRAWLEKHHETQSDLLVGFRKVGSGLPSMTWLESVDEALCFGWIDGVRKRVDDVSYTIRFTPRRAGSIWSAINVGKLRELTAHGRMRAAGKAAFAARTDKKTAIYSFEQAEAAILAPEDERVFRKNLGAWRYFEAAPPGYRHQMLYRIASAKRPQTRARRLAKLIEACEDGRRLD